VLDLVDPFRPEGGRSAAEGRQGSMKPFFGGEGGTRNIPEK
jgi:hypothetical protein